MTTLGKIEKPEAEQYKSRKKIYFVRNLYIPQNATDKYRETVKRYWQEVDEHLTKLEAAGKVSKIFCESIYMTGEESMKVLSAMNVQLEQIVKKKIDAGATFLPLEDKEIFGAFIDWNNCLMLVRTAGVYERVLKFYQEAVKNRFQHIKSVLRDNIAEGEAGLLIMRNDDQQSFDTPEDMELFFITPPAYDDLLKYIRDGESKDEFWRT